MNSKIFQAAGMGLAALVAQTGNAQIEVLHSALTSPSSSQEDLSGLVGSDQAIDTKALVESKAAAVDSSGCVSSFADSSGVVGWYSEPTVIEHPAFDLTENMGKDTAISGSTIAVLGNDRVAVFELNAQQIPEFVDFSNRLPLTFQQVTVSPDGLEIAAVATDSVAFFRRSATNGWSALTSSQSLPIADAPTMGRSITYSSDGMQLFISTPNATPGVQILERNVAGDWELTTDQLPGKFLPGVDRPIAWSSDRLLVADGNSILVYKRAADGFDFSHALGQSGPLRALNVHPNGFAAHSSGSVNYFQYNGTRFVPAFQTQNFADVTGLGVTQTIPIYVGTESPSPLPPTCAAVRFFGQSTNILNARLILPDSLGASAPAIVSGPWGVMVSTIRGIVTQTPGNVYLISRQRIFGGQNPPLGQPTAAGQGGFE